MGVPLAQPMQSLGVPPKHVEQLESHAWHWRLLSRYVASGQTLTQAAPFRIGRLESETHDVHPLEEHVRHVELHAAHVVPSDSTN